MAGGNSLGLGASLKGARTSSDLLRAPRSPPPLPLGGVQRADLSTGYSPSKATAALKKEFPTHPVEVLASALRKGYQLALEQAPDLAVALAAAGFDVMGTAKGLVGAFPSMDPDLLLAAVAKAFRRLDAVRSAQVLRARGLTVPQAAPLLMRRFPQLTADALADVLKGADALAVVQAVDLAMGLAAADFPFTLAGKALKHAFPEISAEQLLDAIQKAYLTPTPLAGEGAVQRRASRSSRARPVWCRPHPRWRGSLGVHAAQQGFTASSPRD